MIPVCLRVQQAKRRIGGDTGGGVEVLVACQGLYTDCRTRSASGNVLFVLWRESVRCSLISLSTPSRSEGRHCLRGKGGGWSWLSSCFGPCGRAGREPFGHTGRLEPQPRGGVTRRAVAQRRSRGGLTRPWAEAIRGFDSGFGLGFVVGPLARSASVRCFFSVLYLLECRGEWSKDFAPSRGEWSKSPSSE